MTKKALSVFTGNISLCMIVKNEEKFIRDCLESVKDVVDEMIIIDTGSSDRTVEIAKSFGAHVYHHPWENDFSKHRNRSISYAKGDWIFWIDADEVLEPGGGEVIKKAVKKSGIDSLMVTMVCYFDNKTRESWNNSIKLFKNNAGIHFEGSVHNRVVGCQKIEYCPVKIYHYGYDLDENNVQKKFERTSNMLIRAIEKEPDNFMHYHNLAVSYASVGLFQKAVSKGLTAMDLYKKTGSIDPNILWIHFVVASSYFNLKMILEAKTMAEKAVRINPDHIDSYFVLAAIYAQQKNKKKFLRIREHAIRLIKKYRKNPELLSGLVVNKIGEEWRLDLEYVNILMTEGSEKQAKKWVARAADHAPIPSLIYRSAAIAGREHGLLSLAEYFLQKALIEGLEQQTAKFEEALNMWASGNVSGYRSIIQALLNTEDINSPELMSAIGTEALKMGKYQQAESLFTSSIGLSYHHPKLFTSMALACKYQNKIDGAITWNLRALDMDERNLDALVNLGNLYFDQKKWESAKSCYERALSIDNHQRNVLFRLSLLELMEQDLVACVKHCDHLLRDLDVDLDMEIEGIEDIMFVYETIGEAFMKVGKKELHLESMNFVRALKVGE